MQATRIKWDETMQARCLARLANAYPQPAVAKKQDPVKAADIDFSFNFDIPAAIPVTKAKPAQKSSKWDDYKKAIDKALEK